MKKIFYGAFALTIGLMSFASCGSKSVKSVQAEDAGESAAEMELLSFDSIVVDTATTVINGNDTLRATVHIQLNLAKGPGADAVNDSILNSDIFMPEFMPKKTEGMTAEQKVRAFAKNFLKGYREELELIKENGQEVSPAFSYSYDISTQVENNMQDSIANYQATGYVFLAGAHGSSLHIARNFRLDSGKMIDKPALLKTDGEKPVLKLIAQQLKKQVKEMTGEESQDELIFMGIKPYVPNNFIVKPDTVTFIYMQDEIAPHVMGEFVVPISKKEIAKYLR